MDDLAAMTEARDSLQARLNHAWSRLSRFDHGCDVAITERDAAVKALCGCEPGAVQAFVEQVIKRAESSRVALCPDCGCVGGGRNARHLDTCTFGAMLKTRQTGGG